ncbi:MAG: hypothetical protein NUV67_02915 [archaeon]|nr:hypothetical protein [archaeon]
MLKGYFVQYKFIIPETTKHSSYTYQKLFRALYGYTQNVTKSNGKTYHYHRKGILSDIPYIRPGKNCVIIPPKSFAALDTFFKTGKNPTHYWRIKGDWKAVFYLDEKNLDPAQVVGAIKEQIKRFFRGNDENLPLPELSLIADRQKAGTPVKKEKAALAVAEAEKIISSPWFKDIYTSDPELRKFYDDYKTIKG